MAASTLATDSCLPEPTVAKVLKLLAKGGVVLSIRGANGGYKLARGPKNISVAQVVTAVDGPVALTACVEKTESDCEHSCKCPVKGRWDGVNDAVRIALEGVSLADMIAPTHDFININTNENIESVQA